MLCSSGPLFCSGLPVVGCCGGGKSRLRGVESELEGGLVGGPSKVGEEVADLFFGGVDHLPRRGLVDGGGNRRAKFLEWSTHLVEKLLGRKLGLVVHGGAWPRGQQRAGPHNGAGR